MTELKFKRGERTASASKAAKAITTGELTDQKLRRLEALLETGRIASRLSGVSTIVKLEEELKYYFIVHTNGTLDIVKTVVELDGFERSGVTEPSIKDNNGAHNHSVFTVASDDALDKQPASKLTVINEEEFDDGTVFEGEPTAQPKMTVTKEGGLIHRIKTMFVEYFDGPKVTKTLKRVR
jgi:hypothetical protein